MSNDQQSNSNSSSNDSNAINFENSLSNDFLESSSSLYSTPSIKPVELMSYPGSDSSIDHIEEELSISHNHQVHEIRKQTKQLRSYVKAKLKDLKLETPIKTHSPFEHKSVCTVHEKDSSMCSPECQIFEQLKNLQEDVKIMNERLSTRESILKTKEQENNELKEALKRLEQNLNVMTGTAYTDFSMQEEENIVCSCSNKCIII